MDNFLLGLTSFHSSKDALGFLLLTLAVWRFVVLIGGAPATAFAIGMHGLIWLTVNIVGAICALQLIVITGLATFQMTQRFFVGETNMSLSPGHVFAYILAGIIVFYSTLASAIAGEPDPRFAVPTQPLVIFFVLPGALSLAAAVVAHRASGSFLWHSLE